MIPPRSSPDSVPTGHRNKRIDGRSRQARRIKELVSSYAKRLGETAGDPVIHANIVRLAEMEAICEDQRAVALRHEPIDLAALTRLQNAARRLRIALGLDGLPPPPPPMTLEQYLEMKQREAVS